MSDPHEVHGSGDLTPDVIRGKRFALRDGAYAPADVHEFLEQVASAMQVLQSADSTQAVRAELQRNADIASRMVIAAQESADMIRAQAGDDARAILDDTRRLAEELRDRAREEVDGARDHIDELRGTFVEELRDMYDRIGASLYRFESASRLREAQNAGSPAAPASAPAAGGDAQSPPQVEPAWRQLEGQQAAQQQPGLQYQPADVGWEEQSRANDEPLAEGEPLVDLRGFAEQAQPAAASGEHAGGELGQVDAGAAPPAPEPPPAQHAPPGEQAASSGGGWLIADAPATPDAPSSHGDAPASPASSTRGDEQQAIANAAMQVEPTAEEEDRRAEALIAGMESVLGVGHDAGPEPLPSPPSLTPENGQSQQATAEQLRPFILQAIHEGTPRDALETWLRATYGIDQPGALIDEALQGSQEGSA